MIAERNRCLLRFRGAEPLLVGFALDLYVF